MREHADYFTQTSPEPMTEEDEETLDWLNRALAGDPRTTDAIIMVEVHGGEVVLRGDTQVPGVKPAAEDVAWGVPGVHSVVNQIVAHGAASGE
ncbi:MAG TPA: BON domain-containing protein [Chloroflexota bacterium]|nr:BON domain-containing protein [Chloroflexota bacterium]